MRTALWTLALILCLLGAGCSMTGDGEVEVPLNEVPNVVILAALGAVPGIVLDEAERETENGTVVYCLEGEADGKDYEIDVSEDGQVLQVELEDEDDDDDGEDDDG